MASARQLIKVAQGEVGYQEQGDNINKYAQELGQQNGLAWCQTFVDWCFYAAFGKETGNELLCGCIMDASTMSVKNAFASHNQLVAVPIPGDIWWRKRPKGGHVGIITNVRVNGSNNFVISTIEGNTSPPGSGGSEWNGDGVYPKSHTIINGHDENGNESWFGRPNYDEVDTFNAYTGGAVYENSSGAGYSSSDFSLNNLFQNVKDTVSPLFTSITNTIESIASVFAERLRSDYIAGTFEITYETVTATIRRDEIQSVDDYNASKEGTNLLSYPSLVEAPYIILQVGNYKFGSYSKESINNTLNINYPNYIQGMTVKKINGQVNRYTINLVYQISYGDDPNLIDKIFGIVGYGTVKISYGDWASPTFVYREEEAIITKLSSDVNFASSQITYTLECTSNSLVLASGYFDFEKINAKPSDRIKDILFDRQYGLQDVFTGMSNKTMVLQKNLIASDDKVVEIEAKHGIDPLSYINYLVTCMSSVTNTDDSPIKDSTYLMSIHDDTYGDEHLNGSYFKVTKVTRSNEILSTADVYSVDIGFPSNNMVTSFKLKNNNSWALLYNYSDTVNTSEYAYSIDNKGNLVTTYSPAVATSANHFKMTESQKTWWTNMTQFPVKASLTIKGLVRSSLLMSYIRVNAYFYGQRHISSGLYIITKQTDNISGVGYRTELELLRIAGDNDYITTVETEVTSTLPVTIYSKPAEVPSELSEKITAIGTRVTNFFENLPENINNAKESLSGILGGYLGGAVTEDEMSSGGGASHRFSSDVQASSKSDIWYVLLKFIGNAYGVAGLMGNLDYESQGFKSDRVEYACINYYKEKGITYTDATYTEAVDTGKLTRENFIHVGSELGDSPYSSTYKHNGRHFGYGLVQWTDDDRKGKLYDRCKAKGVSISDLTTQLEYIIEEMSPGGARAGVLNKLKNANSTDQASDIVLDNYEQPNAEARKASRQERRNLSKQYFQMYGGTTAYNM